MKKILKTIAAILAACALPGITGCSGNAGNRRAADDLVLCADITQTRYSPITLTKSSIENSIRLFDAISADKQNAMFSPLSLNMALGLIEVGASGETKAQIDAYLQTENYADFAKRYMKRAAEELTRTSGKDKYAVEIANSFWADGDIPIKDEYKQLIGKKFGAAVENLDFTDKESVIERINGWVSEKTHKMIPSILDDYEGDLLSVLVNTVYFESAWCDEWDIDKNRNESFTLFDGTKNTLPLMYNGGDRYYENDSAAAFGCYYKNNLMFIGILPKESGEFTLESLDIPSLLESETYEYDVSAVMPRLNFETAFPLKDALIAAGVTDVFDEKTADLSEMSDMPLYLSDILQKTCLELDEKKTKATAVTWGGMTNAAAPEPRERKTVRLDRPFAFMIYDPAERQILFMGKVTDIGE